MKYYSYSVQHHNGTNTEIDDEFETTTKAKDAAYGAQIHWPNAVVHVVEFDRDDEEYSREVHQVCI